MRRLILNLAISLDGFIEGPKGEYDWCFTDQDYGMSDFLEQVDSLLMGRKSYETLLASGAELFTDKHKYVVSNVLESLPGTKDRIISGDLLKNIRRLKIEQGKNIWLFGGAQLTDSLLNAKLVDELQLAVHPVLLGAGKKLFTGVQTRMKLDLIDCRKYSSGLVQLFYRLKN